MLRYARDAHARRATAARRRRIVHVHRRVARLQMRDVAVLSAHGGPGRRSARDRASHVNDVDDGSLLWRAAHTVWLCFLVLGTALGAHLLRTASD